MDKHRANSSVVAVLVLLLVIAGVLYLFWQNQQAAVEPAINTTDVEAIDTNGTSIEVPAPDITQPVEEMTVVDSE